MTPALQLRSIRFDEIEARIDHVLAIGITPAPWDSSNDVGVDWWTVRLPDGGVIAGFDGIGVLTLDRYGSTWRVEYTIACPKAPGADQRRAWLCSAIAALAGPGALVLDAGRVVKGGAA